MPHWLATGFLPRNVHHWRIRQGRSRGICSWVTSHDKKMYELKAFKFMLKSISYTWSSVLSFHPHITKQVELYDLEWSDMADIHDLASTFKQADLHPPPMQPPCLLPKWALSQTNYTGSCNCTYSMQHKCRVSTQDHLSLHCATKYQPNTNQISQACERLYLQLNELLLLCGGLQEKEAFVIRPRTLMWASPNV